MFEIIYVRNLFSTQILSGISALTSLQASLHSPNVRTNIGVMSLLYSFTKFCDSLCAFLFTQFHLLPVIRDLIQFPFFPVDNGSGSAQFVDMLLKSIDVVTNGMYCHETLASPKFY